MDLGTVIILLDVKSENNSVIGVSEVLVKDVLNCAIVIGKVVIIKRYRYSDALR